MTIDLEPENTHTEDSEMQISDKTLARMSWYLYALDDLAKQGKTLAASHEIAEKVGVNSGLVRKDLSHFGGFGRPSVGYNIAYLQNKLSGILCINRVKKVAWVGADQFIGNPQLVKRFNENKCEILAVFDLSHQMHWKRIGKLEVQSYDDIEQVTRELEIDTAVIAAIGDDDARLAADMLIASGVKSILNLSAAVIVAPPGVVVRNIDLVNELIMLSCQCE